MRIGKVADSGLLRSYIRLHLAEGIGPTSVSRLIEAFGGVEAAVGAGPSQWQRVEGVGPKKAEALASVSDELVEQEIAEAEKVGAAIVCLEDDSYPAALKKIYDPPTVLYVWGDLAPADVVALGVVGSRRCTHYGMEQAERFGRLLATAGFTVVSGGARGIAVAAHRGAVGAGGRTIAVMGCGLATLYPPENAGLFRRIVSERQGALVSEIAMCRGVERRNFPGRNRIISGLSLGVLIVEAARRSGALITAREAAEEGREVFVIPGRVDSPLSFGTNQLIRDGAILVQDLDDILEHLGEVGAKMSVEDESAAWVIPQGLDERETKVVEALAEGALGLDEIVRRSGIETGRAASAMTMLVLKGAIRQLPGNVFALKRGGDQN